MSSVVIVGVTGSVAAYRAADVCREIMRNGFEVRACLTRSAEKFVTTSLFEALTGQPVLTDVFSEPIAGRMAHIDWARQADCILVCPATANSIATLASGQADDMFSTIVTASDAPIVIAPAMNPQMYASAANAANLSVLRHRGHLILEPSEGDVACGEQGQGKLAATERIVEAVSEAATRSNLLAGKRIVITAGPTREPLDPIRYLSNRSSGKMGFELARAAIQMGAQVTLIAGPTTQIPHPKANSVSVETAQEMLKATLKACENADVLIGAAAVADFRPAGTSTEKIKNKQGFDMQLIPNEDILAAVRDSHENLIIVGFAAETHEHIGNARAKLAAKRLQAIAVNDVSRTDVGMEVPDNEVTLLFDNDFVEIPKSSKFNIAVRILQELHRRLLP